MLNGFLPSEAAIIKIIAGQLSLSVERPTHPKCVVLPTFIAKRRSSPPARGYVA